MTAALSAGMARATISPPIGLPLAGFAGRKNSDDIHDELSATALYLESGDTSLAIVGCDLAGFSEPLTRAVQQRVASTVGIPEHNILICCSHTHYGPAGTLDLDADPTQRARTGGATLAEQLVSYVDNLISLFAGVVAAARQRRTACKIGYGEATPASASIDASAGEMERSSWVRIPMRRATGDWLSCASTESTDSHSAR